jgi:uncharacterized protein (UPF0548 family)
MTLLDRPLTYPEIGATAGQLPDGYDHLRVHRVIDHEESTFRRAAGHLMSWQMHRAAGLTLETTMPRVEPDSRVRLRLGRHLLRTSFACQVVYVVERERRRGFAYGTLQGHPEQGEERLCLEWRGHDAAAFTITVFSRPGNRWSRPWRRSAIGCSIGPPAGTCTLCSAFSTTGGASHRHHRCASSCHR